MIKVNYYTWVTNPQYRYGDLNKESQIKIEGVGEVLSFSADSSRVVIVDNKTGSFYSVSLHQITRLNSK